MPNVEDSGFLEVEVEGEGEEEGMRGGLDAEDRRGGGGLGLSMP